MKMIRILFITGSRSDYFIQRSILKLANIQKKLKVFVILTGSHFSKKYGKTSNIVKKDNFGKIIELKSFIESSSLNSRSLGASSQFKKIVKILDEVKPHIVIAPYDREEAITISLAATYNNIPVAHLGAGDNTQFNVDALIRHSVSKLAQILFTSTEENKRRLIRMGESKKIIFNVGHNAIDRYKDKKKLSIRKVERYFKISFTDKPVILFIQHPVSNYYKKSEIFFNESLMAIDEINLPTIIIKPNSDPGSNQMIRMIDNYDFKKNNFVKRYSNLDELHFINLMRNISLILGNSSMGILESGIYKTPVVNLGKRQTMRENSGNVIFVDHKKKDIINAVNYSIFNKKYKKKISKCKNIYGKGDASKKIINLLLNTNYNDELLIKKYP